MTYTTTAATNLSLTYDAGQRPITFEASSSANTNDVQNKAYTYHNDGTIKEVDNNVDANFTQTYVTDFASRLKTNHVKDPTEPTGPYTQTIGYDAFSNITSRSTSADGTVRSFTAAYTNHRKTSGGYGTIGSDGFDAAGNVVENNASSTDYRRWNFDARGRTTYWFETSLYAGYTRFDQEETLTIDGDGRVSQTTKRSRMYASPPGNWQETKTYYIHSSVTGQVITELNPSGDRAKTNVYSGKTVIADDQDSWGVRFKTSDPITKSVMQSDLSGEISPYGIGRVEFEALGAVVPHQEPEIQVPHMYSTGGNGANPEYGCVHPVFGDPMPCSTLAAMLNMGLDFPGSEEPTHPDQIPGTRDPHPTLPSYFIGADNRPMGIDRNDPYPGLFLPGDENSHWWDRLGAKAPAAGSCYTYYQMIYENPDVQKYMNELWEQTVASTKQVYEANGTNTTVGAPEFAGLVTINVQDYTHTFWNLGSAKPVKGGYEFPAIPSGVQGRKLLEIHTHIPEPVITSAIGPYANEKDRPWFTSWDPNLVMAPPSGRYASMQDNLRGGGFEGQGASWVGIAVWGKGKFGLYGAETDKEKLKKMCVPDQRVTLSKSL